MVHACPQLQLYVPEWALDYPRVKGSTLIERGPRRRKVPAIQKTAVNVMRTEEISEDVCISMTSRHFQMNYLHGDEIVNDVPAKFSAIFKNIPIA